MSLCAAKALLNACLDAVVSGTNRWRARRELDQILSNSNSGMVDMSSVISESLSVLQQNPELARERFLHLRRNKEVEMYPLSVFVLHGAHLEIIQEVYRMYRNAACQSVIPDSSTSEYPLHLACQVDQASEEHILFLAKAYPPAVRTKNSNGNLPIHVLLRNWRCVITLSVIKTLLGLYEQESGTLDKAVSSSPKAKRGETSGNWRGGNDDFTAMLSLAFQNDNVKHGILDLLTSKFPQECKELHVGKSAYDDSSTGHTMSMARVESLKTLLPHLRTFHCTSKEWFAEAFLAFMRELRHNESLTHLTIFVPFSVLRSQGDSVALSLILRQIAAENATLQHLRLDFRVRDSLEDGEEVTLVAERVKICMRRFLGGLRYNSTLKEWRGVWAPSVSPEFVDPGFWSALADLLQQHNSTLESVSSWDSFLCDHISVNVGRVEFWTTLNRSGRCRIRDCSVGMNEIIALLLTAQDTAEHARDLQEIQGILFEFLLESTSSWIGQRRCELKGPKCGERIRKRQRLCCEEASKK